MIRRNSTLIDHFDSMAKSLKSTLAQVMLYLCLYWKYYLAISGAEKTFRPCVFTFSILSWCPIHERRTASYKKPSCLSILTNQRTVHVLPYYTAFCPKHVFSLLPIQPILAAKKCGGNDFRRFVQSVLKLPESVNKRWNQLSLKELKKLCKDKVLISRSFDETW